MLQRRAVLMTVYSILLNVQMPSWASEVEPSQTTGRISAVTEDFPPFQYKEGQQITGLSTEIVEAMFEQANVEAKVQMVAWARAYKQALNEQNVVIFSIARTVKREPLFLWIGSIVDYQVFLYKRTDRNEVQVENLSDAMKYRIGGVYDDVKQDYLVRQGFTVGPNLQLVKDEKTNLIKLFNKRIDLMPSEATAFNYLLTDLGYESKDFEKAFFLEGVSSKLYVAMSQGSSQEIFEKLKHGLSALKQTPKFARIKKKYLGDS